MERDRRQVYKVDNFINRFQGDGVMPAALESKGVDATLPSAEQSVVDELLEVLGRHRDHSPARLAALAGRAIELALGSGRSREAKVVRARARGLGVRQELMEAEGGSWSSDEVARSLGISKTAVFKRLAAGRLLAWREERLQAARFPCWQFDAHGQVLAGFEDVLRVLERDDRLDVWARVLFFLGERPGLGGRRPLDLLRDGRVGEVLVAAGAYVE